LSVRVNSPGTRWCHDDLIACAGAGVDSVVVPKADVAGLHFADRLLAGAEAAVGREARMEIQC